MGESFKEFSKRTGLPQPQSTYIFLAIQGKDVWNHWINGEMSEDEEAALAKKLGFSVLPNRNSTPNFSSIDFRDDPIKDIDFTDFEFPTKLRVHNAIIVYVSCHSTNGHVKRSRPHDCAACGKLCRKYTRKTSLVTCSLKNDALNVAT